METPVFHKLSTRPLKPLRLEWLEWQSEITSRVSRTFVRENRREKTEIMVFLEKGRSFRKKTLFGKERPTRPKEDTFRDIYWEQLRLLLGREDVCIRKGKVF